MIFLPSWIFDWVYVQANDDMVSFHCDFSLDTNAPENWLSLYQDTDTGFMLITFWWCFFMHRILHKCCWDSFVSEWMQRSWDQPAQTQKLALFTQDHPPLTILWHVWGHLFETVLRNANHWFLRDLETTYPLAKVHSALKCSLKWSLIITFGEQKFLRRYSLLWSAV